MNADPGTVYTTKWNVTKKNQSIISQSKRAEPHITALMHSPVIHDHSQHKLVPVWSPFLDSQHHKSYSCIPWGQMIIHRCCFIDEQVISTTAFTKTQGRNAVKTSQLNDVKLTASVLTVLSKEAVFQVSEFVTVNTFFQNRYMQFIEI